MSDAASYITGTVLRDRAADAGLPAGRLSRLGRVLRAAGLLIGSAGFGSRSNSSVIVRARRAGGGELAAQLPGEGADQVLSIVPMVVPTTCWLGSATVPTPSSAMVSTALPSGSARICTMDVARRGDPGRRA